MKSCADPEAITFTLILLSSGKSFSPQLILLFNTHNFHFQYKPHYNISNNPVKNIITNNIVPFFYNIVLKLRHACIIIV